jgi:diamine N-acetyltransferase
MSTRARRALAPFRRMLEDGKLTIRPITYDDTANIIKWRNAPEVLNNLVSQEKLTAEAHDNYMKTHVETGLVVQFIISYAGTDIGTGFIKNIDRELNRAETGLFIGETEYLGGGAGILAYILVVDYALDVMNFDYLYCRVQKTNTVALRMNRLIGYEDIDDPSALGIPDVDDSEMVYLVLKNEPEAPPDK